MFKEKVARSFLQRLIYSDADDSNQLIAAHGKVTDAIVNAALNTRHPDYLAATAPLSPALMSSRARFEFPQRGAIDPANRVLADQMIDRYRGADRMFDKNPGLFFGMLTRRGLGVPTENFDTRMLGAHREQMTGLSRADKNWVSETAHPRRLRKVVRDRVEQLAQAGKKAVDI